MPKIDHSWATEARRYWASKGLSGARPGYVLHHPYGRIGKGFYIYIEMTIEEHKAFHKMYGYKTNGGPFFRQFPYMNFWEYLRKLLGG